jgi:hypothetical protein
VCDDGCRRKSCFGGVFDLRGVLVKKSRVDEGKVPGSCKLDVDPSFLIISSVGSAENVFIIWNTPKRRTGAGLAQFGARRCSEECKETRKCCAIWL